MPPPPLPTLLPLNYSQKRGGKKAEGGATSAPPSVPSDVPPSPFRASIYLSKKPATTTKDPIDPHPIRIPLQTQRKRKRQRITSENQPAPPVVSFRNTRNKGQKEHSPRLCWFFASPLFCSPSPLPSTKKFEGGRNNRIQAHFPRFPSLSPHPPIPQWSKKDTKRRQRHPPTPSLQTYEHMGTKLKSNQVMKDIIPFSSSLHLAAPPPLASRPRPPLRPPLPLRLASLPLLLY